MYKWRTGWGNAAPRLTFHVNSNTLPPKHKDPHGVHDHDLNITGKDINPFSEGKETQLYYGRGKTGVPGEKTAARPQNDANPEEGLGLHALGETSLTPTDLTQQRLELPVRGWHHLPKKNDYGMPIMDPWLSRHTNACKSAREMFTAILNESGTNMSGRTNVIILALVLCVREQQL